MTPLSHPRPSNDRVRAAATTLGRNGDREPAHMARAARALAAADAVDPIRAAVRDLHARWHGGHPLRGWSEAMSDLIVALDAEEAP